MLKSPHECHERGIDKDCRERGIEGKSGTTSGTRQFAWLRLWICSFACLMVAHTAVADASAFVFNVKPSTADVVLKKIAEQSDTQILFPLDQVRSIKANGLEGKYSVSEALKLALAGSGLRAEYLESGAIAVSFASGPQGQEGKDQMNRSRKGAIYNAIAWLVALLPTTADAQQNENEPFESLEAVVVTGSLIKRTEESSQLVTNIDAEELFQRGTTNAVEILSAITQNQPLATSNDGARQGGLTNQANLRTLGPENTLVLINGKRVVNNPIFDTGVDLNTVPTALIYSVDVLADGASSIYGSDAVAGVINFRTKSNFDGLEYNLSTLEPTEKGGDLRSASLSAGLGSLQEDNWNFVAGASWREKKEILSLDRGFSNTSVLPQHGINNLLNQPFPANLSQPGTIDNANPYPCTPPELAPARGGCGLDSDAAGLISLQNPETQKSAYARFSNLLGEQKLSIEYLWAESSIKSALTGTTLFGYTVPNTSPFYPGNGIVPTVPNLDPTQSIFITSRFTPGGRRTTENRSETDRVLAQLEGEIGGFGYEVWALQSNSTALLNSVKGAMLISGLIDGFAGTNGAPFINPFGVQSPESARYLESIQIHDTLARGDATLAMAGITLSRALFNLPAGSVSAALAYEYADDEMEYTLSPINALLEGGVVGNGVEAIGDRTRNSVTAEFLIPIFSGLEADASVRFDDYSDFGNTTNPKLLLSYDVTDSVNLHASYNKGFRAPPLPKLFAPQALGFVSGLRNDPVLCPGGVVNTGEGGIALRDCFVAFNSLSGGNPELQPQRSKAFAAGISVRLVDSLPHGTAAFGLDYWDYELTRAIGVLSPDAIFANPTEFASYIVRCSEADPVFESQSDGCNFPGGTTGDPIAYVALTNANVGTTRTSGIDLTASWSAETRIGAISVGYRGTYVTEYEFQRRPDDPFVSRRGKYLDGYPAIEYNHYLTLAWERNAWAASLQNSLRGGYDDCNEPCFVGAEDFNDVGAYSLWNLTTSYRFNETLSVTLRVDNLFDQDPPFTNGFNSNCTGCDLRFIDPTGRAIGLTFTGKLGFGRN